MSDDEIYFRDQIDWKFANYLTDKSTYIEDKYGVYIYIKAGVRTRETLFRPIYSINSNKFVYFGSTDLDYLKGNGMWYIITIMTYDGVAYKLSNSKNILDEYLQRISSKSSIFRTNSNNEVYIQSLKDSD